jgi:hypothetical protein
MISHNAYRIINLKKRDSMGDIPNVYMCFFASSIYIQLSNEQGIK